MPADFAPLDQQVATAVTLAADSDTVAGGVEQLINAMEAATLGRIDAAVKADNDIDNSKIAGLQTQLSEPFAVFRANLNRISAAVVTGTPSAPPNTGGGV